VSTNHSRRAALAAPLAVAAVPVAAQPANRTTARKNLRFIAPATMADAPTYSHIVEVIGPGRLLYASGERGSDKDGKLPSDFRAQAVQAFENLKAALAAAGATFEDVVKINVYLLDMKAHHAILSDVKKTYVSKTAPPASTTLQVSLLTREGALVEMDVVAALPP
jgi:enamine deaminase RidA (YjgF/YER057c/UK114 family)